MVDVARPKSVTKRRQYKKVAIACAVLALVALVTFAVARLKPAAPSVERSTLYMGTVKRGEMLRQVRGLGTLVPEQVRVVAAATEGRIERIYVQAGEQVSAGTVLMELSNPSLQQAAVDAEYQIRAAEAEMNNIRVRLESERMTQQATVASAQSEFNQARLQLDVDEKLAKDGLVPALQLRLARVRVDELANRLRIEQQRAGMSGQAKQAQVATQQARIDQLRALAGLNRTQAASLRIVSGNAGVVQQVSVEAGQQVSPGTNLARVADQTTLKAQLQIPETQARDVQLGQRASVDTRTSGVIEGVVQRIDPAVQAGTVTVDVRLTGGLPQGARPDLSVDGTIELERLENALHVARPAFGGGAQSQISMFRIEEAGRVAVRVPVKLGRSSVNTVEILEGLREGDEVILSDTSQWDSFNRLELK